MPCRDYMPSRDYRENPPASQAESECRDLQNRLDALTAHLCYVMSQCEDVLPRSPRANRARDWYEQHRKADIANMLELVARLDEEFLTNMDKDDFDTLDATLNDML